MPWFKVDDNLGFHHKVIAAGNPAMGLWVRAGSICAQQLTDGYVPDHMIAALGTKAQAEKLVTVGLWDRAQGGYTFHGWSERQPSKVSVEAERAAAADRMREYRAKRKTGTQKGSPQASDSRAEDVQANERRTNGEVQRSFGNPDPVPVPTQSRPDPKDVVPDGPMAPGRGLALVGSDRPDVARICKHLADRIEANGSKRPTVGKGWLDAARLMLDRDKRSEEEIHGAIDWCQTDEFWRSNVMSLPTLREKYDTLRLQAQRRGRPSKQQETDDLFERAARRMGVTGGSL